MLHNDLSKYQNKGYKKRFNCKLQPFRFAFLFSSLRANNRRLKFLFQFLNFPSSILKSTTKLLRLLHTSDATAIANATGKHVYLHFLVYVSVSASTSFLCCSVGVCDCDCVANVTVINDMHIVNKQRTLFNTLSITYCSTHFLCPSYFMLSAANS